MTRLVQVALLGIVGLSSVFVLWLLYQFNPLAVGFYPKCPTYAFLGLHCAGCGSLRAVHQLLHGHVVAALGFNPLMVLSLPLVGWGAAQRWLHLRGWVRSSGWLYARYTPAIVGAVVVLYTVARNLPFAVFDCLRP